MGWEEAEKEQAKPVNNTGIIANTEVCVPAQSGMHGHSPCFSAGTSLTCLGFRWLIFSNMSLNLNPFSNGEAHDNGIYFKLVSVHLVSAHLWFVLLRVQQEPLLIQNFLNALFSDQFAMQLLSLRNLEV